jgi:hypothetical protein
MKPKHIENGRVFFKVYNNEIKEKNLKIYIEGKEKENSSHIIWRGENFLNFYCYETLISIRYFCNGWKLYYIVCIKQNFAF